MEYYIHENSSEFIFDNENEMNYIITELEKSIENREKQPNGKIFRIDAKNIRHCLEKWKENAIYSDENNLNGKISTTLNQENTADMFLSMIYILVLSNIKSTKTAENI